MSTQTSNPEIRNGLYIAEFIEDDLSYGLGNIRPQPEQQGNLHELVEAVLDSIEAVEPSELKYSCCTDGRCPKCLQDGGTVPVREQLVGADAMTGFHMAEMLGPRFYTDFNAPVEVRFLEVLHFLRENDFGLGTHLACGAAKDYVLILQNMKTFGQVFQFNERTKLFVPEDVYDDRLATESLAQSQRNLADSKYEGYSEDIVLSGVRQVSGDHAIAELVDDGRGIGGHVEEAVGRLHESIVGYAINEAGLMQRTNGREVFGVNNSRITRLAEAFGRGLDTDYRIARIAGEQFTNAGHATLASNLPTFVVRPA